MSKTYQCLPTDLWIFDPATPRGFYFNRAILYFGSLVESEMAEADANSRKNRKPGAGTDALANAARLAVLERRTGVKIKRHREPDKVGFMGSAGKITDEPGKQTKDISTVVWKESG